MKESESSQQILSFAAFDDQNNTVELTEVSITFTITNSIGGLAKNFNNETSLSGTLNLSNNISIANNTLGFELPDETVSYSDLATAISFAHDFSEIPQSTVENYTAYRDDGSNASDFQEEELSNNKEVIFSYSGDKLTFFTDGNTPSFSVDLTSSATVSNSHEDLLYDFDSSSDVQIKVEYKYRLK